MSDDLAEVKEVILEDGPGSIELDVFRGKDGPRGTWIIPGSGNPSSYYNALEGKYIYPDGRGVLPRLEAQFYDWYVDLDASSPTYLTTFQLKENNQWDVIFKVTPNMYHTNRVLSFVGGVATTDVVVLKESLPLEQKYGNNIDIADFKINLEIDLESIPPDLPYPVILSFTPGVATSDSTSYTFPITIVASQLHPINGVEAISGNRIAHISISVI